MRDMRALVKLLLEIGQQREVELEQANHVEEDDVYFVDVPSDGRSGESECHVGDRVDGGPMDVNPINSLLRQEGPDRMVLESFEIRGRRLVLAFEFDGGPREDYQLVVEFKEIIVFHLPSVLHSPTFFRCASKPERERLIPAVSYDAAEVSGGPGASTVVAMDDANGVPLGYYLVADSVAAAWRIGTTER